MLKLADFKHKTVLIMGLGLHGGGLGAAKFFSRLGSRVIVTDLKTKKELVPSIAKLRRFKNITYRLGGHRAEDFRSADYLIKGPGVPESSKYLKIAKGARVPVLSDVEIFFHLCPAPIIGITGTKGKSTAASLLFGLLGAQIGRGSRTAPWVRPSRIRRGSKVWLGGNIRKSVLELLPRVRKGDWVVLELSSFQLDSLKSSRRSPAIALITNIFPDHLNRYPSMAAYSASKATIFKFQKRSDLLFINAKDTPLKRVAKGAPGRVIRFDPQRIMRPFRRELAPGIPPYQLPNVAGAIAIAKRLGVGERPIKNVLRRFGGMPGRMQVVRTVRGVEFINDTTATNPGAAEQAVIATKRRIGTHGLHVIAGGYDKGLPVEDFVRALARHAATVVFLPGKASERIESRIQNLESRKLNVFHAKTMRGAVRIAHQNAERGDVVLLSPGGASFGLFRHEFDRGDQFVRAVRRLR